MTSSSLLTDVAYTIWGWLSLERGHLRFLLLSLGIGKKKYKLASPKHCHLMASLLYLADFPVSSLGALLPYMIPECQKYRPHAVAAKGRPEREVLGTSSSAEHLGAPTSLCSL